RFIVCLLLLPILTIYSDLLGVLGGWIVSTKFLGVPDQPYWQYSAEAVDTWQIMDGVYKSFLFGGASGLLSCYQGCTCSSAASGTGKSVLLKHIVGLLRPDHGEVWFDGKRIDNLPERDLVPIRTRFGFLFQMGALFDSLNVAENIGFPIVEHTHKPTDEIAKI